MKVFEAIEKSISIGCHQPDYNGEWLAEHIDTEKALQCLFSAFDNIFGYGNVVEGDLKVHYTFLSKTTITANGWSFCNPIEEGTVVCWWNEQPLAIIEVTYENDGAWYSTTLSHDVFSTLMWYIAAKMKNDGWGNCLESEQQRPFETRTQTDNNLMYELGR